MTNEWEEYLVALAPRWLRTPTAEALARSIGTQLDALEQGARDAIKAAFVEVCPEDAIAFHAAARRLEPYPGESLSAWRARVAAAWDSLYYLGTAQGIQIAFAAMGWTATVYGSHDSAPPWWGAAWPPAPRNPRPAWWSGAWPVAHGDTQWMSRFWVVLEAPGPWGWEVARSWGADVWGSGWLWGLDKAREVDVQLVRRIVERWRPANEVCDGILVHFPDDSVAWLRGTDRQ